MARVLMNMPSQFGGKPSGVARVGFRLLEELLVDARHDYVLRSNWSRDELPAALRDHRRLELVQVPRPRFMIADVLRQLWTVPALCRRLAIDIVWNVDAFGAARGGRARITTIHDFYFRTLPEMFRGFSAMTSAACYRIVLAGSTRVATISEETRRDLLADYPALASRTEVIYNDGTLDPAGHAPGLSDPALSQPYVLLVGNGTPNKNFAVVIAALAACRSGLALVHVGHDGGGMIACALAAAPIPPKVTSLSDIDDAQLARLYAGACCLVVPSLAEGFCLPIVEAQTLGCPVIASSASVMPEIAGGGALFFDPHNPAELAAQIDLLAADAALRARLIARGSANRARFSWAAAAARYAAIFGELARAAA